MSFLVTLTFDLTGADTNVYPRIASDLLKIDLAKVLTVRKHKKVHLRRRLLKTKKEVSLPSNTFVAKIPKMSFQKSKEVRDYVASEIRTIFSNRDVGGRYFIAVGDEWAWSAGPV